MHVPIRRILTLLLVGIALLGGDRLVVAQQADVRTVEQDSRHLVLEVTATWQRPLKATLDSARVETLGEIDLYTLPMGLWESSETVRLPALAEPRVRVLAAEFDEVAVPLAASEGERMSALTTDPVRLVGLGLERKQPVVSVAARMFAYDEASGSLRRYRRMRIDIEFGAAKSALSGPVQNPHLSVERSVLADGIVFKIPITESGIYRIDRAFLEALGLTPDNIEPDNLQIFGNGGAPVPALNSADRIADLAENPVFVRGGGDGSFGANDVLLFYGSAPRGWRYNTQEEIWEHFTHPFSNQNYYFLKVGAEAGQRVTDPGFANLTGAVQVNSVVGRFVKDIDETVWSKEHGSGHTWVSNQIRVGGALEVLTDEVLPGLIPGTVDYEVRVAIQSNPVATVAFSSGGVQLATQRSPRSVVANDPISAAAVPTTARFSQTAGAGGLNLTMQLLNQVNEPQAAVDWVRVFYEKALRSEGEALRFTTPPGQTGGFEMVLSSFVQAPQVWDVTDPPYIRRLGVQGQGTTYRVHVGAPVLAQPRELIAFTEADARTLDAAAATQVPNQNLHGIQGFPDFVIITPVPFLEVANELADIRRQEGLEVVVTQVNDIYNEFSGGLPDMRAIRDYFKFLYDRAPNPESLLRYALLLGDGHYDFRQLATEQALDNWIFPYETEESYIPDASFTSDDYFGLLDDNEGVWAYRDFRSTTFERVDIGIGRLPVQTAEEARLMLDKIKRYESPETYGPWRTLYTFAADDGPTGLSGTDNDVDLHVQNVDQVAELIRGGLFPQINIRKIYAESFQRVFLNGFRIPDAKQEISNAINSGTLLFNYSGHGGPDGLAQEELFTKEDAAALTNKDQQSIFITATCSFGWWDIEDEQSGAEVLLLNPNGGAIALMTTVRLVYTSRDTTSLNAGLNRALNREFFRLDEDGLPRRLGDVIQASKNTTVGLQGNSRKLGLLGDPTMRLGLPRGEAVVESLNEVPVDQQVGQMRALDRITITGAIRTPDGLVDASFDGLVNVTVFDAVRRVSLIEQLHMPTPYYTVREDLIWRGEVQANAGRFSATFVVPKDISYSNEPGRVTVYAASEDGQALGFNENFLVGGTSPNPPNDAIGPQISLFLNDTTFVSGGLITPEAELIVKLSDESGINTVGAGVGHEVLLVIDGDESRAVDISDNFRSVENSFQRGEVRWPLPTLKPGAGSLSVRAWDVLNNSNAADLEYLVTATENLELRNVFNYPNPMNRLTRFVFEHNQPPGTPARVQVRIYTLNGRPIRTIETDEALPDGVLTSGPVQVLWDGRDADFDRVTSGIYLYKLRVEVGLDDGEREVVERIEKLAVIR